MSKPASYDNLLDRVRARVAKSASASDQGIAVPSEKDPSNKGGVAAPGDEALDGKKEKQTVPESKSNVDNGPAGKTLENQEAGTHGSGDGNKGPAPKRPDELPAGGDLYNKQASEVVELLKQRIGLKQASSEKPSKEEGTKKEAKKSEDVELPSEFTTEFHVKLASQLLASEEGRDHARSILADAMGAEAVDTLIKKAEAMETELQQHEQFQNHVKQAMEQMTPEDRDEFVKSAKFHQSEVESLETNFEKSAYGQGAMDAAAMQQGGGLPEIPEEGSDMTIEEIVMILDQLVQSGEIEPQLADAVLQAVMAEMGGAPAALAAGGAPMDPAALAAGGAPMDPAALAAGAGMEEMPKAASTDSIIDAVTNEKKED